MAEINPLVLQSQGLSLDCRLPVNGGAHVMGILNVTPDSFSDGGQYLDARRAVARATKMAEERALIIDVGGASSRPKGSAYGEGAQLVPLEEELRRVLPVVEEIVRSLPGVWISVDTFRSEVARAVLSAGAHIINDITALRFDPDLAQVCAAHEAPLVLMHSVGLPGAMPHDSDVSEHPEADIIPQIYAELETAASVAVRSGCTQILLDPGFGFGKSLHQNGQLIAELSRFKALGWPLLIGVSRKSSVGHFIAKDGIIPGPNERLFGSLGVTALGVLAGAAIVRTHDVRETIEFLAALDATRRTSKL